MASPVTGPGWYRARPAGGLERVAGPDEQPDPSVNPNRGSHRVLHGGEPRLTQDEIAASFAASRAEHPDLIGEDAFLTALLAGNGRTVMDGGGLTFHSRGAHATIRYTSGARRWRLTLEETRG